MSAELGLRAVACKGWRWMPGMLANCGQSAQCRLIAPVHGGWKVVQLLGDSPQLMEVGVDWLDPDLSDHATLGCLLALVREAWRCPGVYARESGRGGWVVCVRSLDPNGPVLAGPFRADTEAEALVAALESAP